MNQLLKYLRYSMGNFANTIAYNVFSNRVQFYYVDVLGLSAATAGTLWTIFGLWNMVNDPLMGQLTDRTRSRYGRRIPYVLFGAIPLGLSFFLLWTPVQQPPWVLAAYFLAILFIFDTLYSLLLICYNSLFVEVAPTVRQRVDLAMVREIIATVALLASFILAPILAENVGYVWMGASMGGLVSVGYLVSVVGVRERPLDHAETQVGLLSGLRIALSSIAFRWYLGAAIAKEYIWLTLAAMLPFWRKYAIDIQSPISIWGLELGPGDAEAVLLGLAIVMAIPCLFVWRPIVHRLGYRLSWILASLVFIPGLLMMMLASDFYTGLAGTLLTAPGLAGSMIMPYPVITEVIDEDARREHGYRRDGIFFGMNAGIAKLSFPIYGILFACVLPVSGYIEGQSLQSPTAILGIRFLIGGTTILASLVMAYCMWRYPLGRKPSRDL
ncbi:MAG: MFS transporter [Pirellulaceae bacterium]|nr:MFS transporter [Pirellulaceae bacterium]